jgi:taurine--2-oxoglutarate transaminase
VSPKLTAQEIVDLSSKYTFYSWSVQSAVAPIPMVTGKGVYFWDADGKRYLDFSSQLMNLNIGHQHPKVIKAIQDQAGILAYAHPSMATEPRGLAGKKIADVAPGDLNKTFLCLGGAEANENAIKFARFFTGRHKILARYRSYHGATYGAIALTGDYRRLAVEPAMPGSVHFLDPYCYRCPFGWTKETCHRECISHVEEVIQYEGPNNIAAIIMEGVTGSNGLIVPPDDYWPRIREICSDEWLGSNREMVCSG